jgi:acyl carrier protein
MTFEKIAKMIAEYKDTDISEIKVESTFDDLELDSLDKVEIVIMLEDEFQINLDISEEIRTVGDLIAFVEKAKA